MIIQKILNNNVVVSQNEENEEVIVMGRGLAFSKKNGDRISKDQIDKVFVLQNNDNLSHFTELLKQIPIEYFMITDQIIQKAKLVLGKPLNENLYISLSDHLYGTVERHQRGVELKNVLNLEIKRFYADEYAVGLYAITLIEDELKVRLPEDEAGFIALHLFNGQMEDDFHEAMDMTEMIQRILKQVEDFFDIQFDEESVYFFRFMTHLKFFAYRVLSGKTYDGEDERALLSLMSKKHPEAYACVLEVSRCLNDEYHYIMSSEEKLYLTIHISKVVMEGIQ